MESEKLGTCETQKWEHKIAPHRKSITCVNWRKQPQGEATASDPLAKYARCDAVKRKAAQTENFEKIMEFCCKFADTVAKLRRTEFWQGVPARARRGKFRFARAAWKDTHEKSTKMVGPKTR